jgi:hypothetical protein
VSEGAAVTARPEWENFPRNQTSAFLLVWCHSPQLPERSQLTDATKVMAVLDEINGDGVEVRFVLPVCREIRGMRREMMSQSYTTKLDQLWKVTCA